MLTQTIFYYLFLFMVSACIDWRNIRDVITKQTQNTVFFVLSHL